MSHAPAPDDLRALAEAVGVAVDWHDAQGRARTVGADVLIPYLAALGFEAESESQREQSLARLRASSSSPTLHVGRIGESICVPGASGAYTIELEAGAGSLQGHAEDAGDGQVRLTLPDTPGYHRLLLGSTACELAVCPTRAPSVDDIAGRTGVRLWGPVAQVYSLRQAHHGRTARAAGVGDFGALAELARRAAAQGADALAISPVHAMFSANPGAYSPYGPSSRLFLNVTYADPLALFGESEVDAALRQFGSAQNMIALDDQPLIDWPAVNMRRHRLLRALYDRAYQDGATPQWHAQLEHFIAQGGQTLARHACFEVLHAAHVRETGQMGGWQQWRAQWRDPEDPAVADFARAHAHDVRFHSFAQWLAARGLSGAQRQACEAGMAIGLIGDLAVGTDPGGSHAWSRQADLLRGLSSGAPPDIYNPAGQGWGLTAFSPFALKRSGYAAFIELLRAVLAHAGGIRIDHVLGLARTWLIPDGNGPADGAYLTFPFQDMLNLIALEAWRHRAIVIGENLGTVPQGFNRTISQAGMLGMNVLLFERDYDGPVKPAPYTPPTSWPSDYLATSTTHDLPTLAGWWRERDIDWKVDLDLLNGEQTEEMLRQQRADDRQAMAHALGLTGPITASGEAPVAAMLDWTCSGPQPLALIPLEDLLALTEQPNIPGTITEHPNWRRRLPVTLDTLFELTPTRAALAAIQTARSRQ